MTTTQKPRPTAQTQKMKKPRTPSDVLEMIEKMGPDGRSMAAMKAAGVSPKRLNVKEMVAKMKTGKGNPAGKDLSPMGMAESRLKGLKSKLMGDPSVTRKGLQPETAKKGGLMKAKKKKAKKSKTAGRLAKRGYGAARK